MDALKAQGLKAAAENPAAKAAQEAAEKAAASDPKAAAALAMAKAEAAKKSAGSGEEVTKKYVTGAITQPIPLIAHRFLTGIFPFAMLQPIASLVPGLGDIYQSVYAMCFSLFYVLGSNGANLIFTGSKLMGLAKFASNQMIGGVYMLLAHFFPGKWWLRPLKSILYYGNPWFTFDIVQTYSPNFARQGYKLPFINKFLNQTISDNEAIKKANQDLLNETDADGNPSLTTGEDDNGKAIYVEGTKKPGCLKPLTSAEIGFKVPATDETGNVKKTEEGKTQYVIDPSTKEAKISYGQTTGLLIGMVAVFALPFWYANVSANIPPTLQATLTSWANWGMSTLGMVMAGTAAVGAAGIYALPGLLPQLTGLMSTQAGGAQKGGKLPDMSKVIQEALDNTPDEMPLQQGGGGAIDIDESVMFLGSLAIASLVGITLAVMRNKKLSRGSV